VVWRTHGIAQLPVFRTTGATMILRAHVAREAGGLPEPATWGLGKQS
jgi:hypothetical protein